MAESKDSLGDRMKFYEKAAGCEEVFLPMLPIVVRLDGKAFHSFTKGLDRPFDERFRKLMVATTEFLVQYTNARIGYTQSDEITLIFYSGEPKSQVFFDGRRDKIITILAAKATQFFNRHLPDFLPSKSNLKDENAPVFDARAFMVPARYEAVNALIWREQDATKNSISMVAQAHFSHKSLQGKNGKEMQEMLFQEKGINWNDYPAAFKRGTYVQRRKVTRPFTVEELSKLPPKHKARQNPDLVVERTEIQIIDMPILTKVINQEEVVFEGAAPKVA